MFIVSLLIIKIKVNIIFGNNNTIFTYIMYNKMRDTIHLHRNKAHFCVSIPLYICCRHLVKSRICQLNAYYEKPWQIMCTKKPVILVIKYVG